MGSNSNYMGDEIAPASSKSEDLLGNKMKFLCSFGGKILPRPSDGQLRYVGGDTRLVTVHRTITFQDFMKKLEDLLETMSVIIKYQLPTLDLDTLISVVSDEDLQNMMEEYDRYESHKESCSHPRLRAFLFPQIPPLPSTENRVSPTQRYVDAVNGALVKKNISSLPLLNVPDYFSDLESNGATEIDCQSPMAPWTDESPLTSCPSSPYKQKMRKVPSEGASMNSPSKMGIHLHRVRSSPNLIRSYQSNIVPAPIYNIVPSRQVLMGVNSHGRPATINRREGGPTPEGSLQFATHAAPKIRNAIYASSPLKYMKP